LFGAMPRLYEVGGGMMELLLMLLLRHTMLCRRMLWTLPRQSNGASVCQQHINFM
jgi:hypothetical protein